MGLDPRTKYIRRIVSRDGSNFVEADVYQILEAFDVRCPARQHAIKKLLCAGIRGKGSQLSDLSESLISIDRAVQLQQVREQQ